jgi:hypothetical protein
LSARIGLWPRLSATLRAFGSRFQPVVSERGGKLG